MKVGRDLDADDRRAALIREEIGRDGVLMMDANQVWGVDEAIAAMRRARASSTRGGSRSRRAPTTSSVTRASAREIAPIGVATGEHVQNRVIFKQLLQAEAIDVCQIDACRLGGVNEVLAVLLLAAKFGIPVCPHAGGVGLCEYVQHLAMFDYIARQRLARGPRRRVRRPPARALRRSGRRRERPLPRCRGARLQHRDAARVARRVRVSRRAGLGRRRGRGRRAMMVTTAMQTAEHVAERARRSTRPLPAAAGGAARACAPGRR